MEELLDIGAERVDRLENAGNHVRPLLNLAFQEL